jgi:hypothetical protein
MPADEVTLPHAEQTLKRYAPEEFDTNMAAAPECIEAVRAVVDKEAWRSAYPSKQAFYDAHRARHPDVMNYARVRRAIARGDASGTIQEQLRRLRES